MKCVPFEMSKETESETTAHPHQRKWLMGESGEEGEMEEEGEAEEVTQTT